MYIYPRDIRCINIFNRTRGIGQKRGGIKVLNERVKWGTDVHKRFCKWYTSVLSGNKTYHYVSFNGSKDKAGQSIIFTVLVSSYLLQKAEWMRLKPLDIIIILTFLWCKTITIFLVLSNWSLFKCLSYISYSDFLLLSFYIVCPMKKLKPSSANLKADSCSSSKYEIQLRNNL